MARVTFGAILQDARERKGYDLSTAARRLRIRPDILRAIEDNDFARMPPRGYTRNMVNAYARLLGLSPTEITRMYLDEAYAYQVGRARSTSEPASSYSKSDTSRSKRIPRPSRQEERDEVNPQQNAFGRKLYDDRTAFSRSDYGQPRSSTSASQSTNRVRSEGRTRPEGRTHASKHPAIPNGHYTNFYAGPRAPGGLQAKLPLIIGGAVVLILIIVMATLAFGNKGNSAEDVPSIPITGMTDTTQDEAGGQSTTPIEPVVVAPTKAVLEYEVKTGETAWVELYTDGSTTASSASGITGPKKETVDVPGTLTISTPRPDAVTVLVDGAPVELVASGNGYYSYTVDFPAILEQWKEANPTPDTASDTAAGANTSDTAA